MQTYLKGRDEGHCLCAHWPDESQKTGIDSGRFSLLRVVAPSGVLLQRRDNGPGEGRIVLCEVLPRRVPGHHDHEVVLGIYPIRFR